MLLVSTLVRPFVPPARAWGNVLDSAFSGLEVLYFIHYRNGIDSIVNYTSTSLLSHAIISEAMYTLGRI